MTLHEHVSYGIAEFLQKYCMPKKIYSGLDPKKVSVFIEDSLKESAFQFDTNVANIYKDVVSWILHMTSLATSLHIFNTGGEGSNKKAFESRVKLIIKGIQLATQIKNLIRKSILLRF